MSTVVKGAFDIKGTPRPPGSLDEKLQAMSMTFHKTFHGDLAGTSVVEMIGVMDKALGSGAYVALERISGSLKGKTGTFCLQHSSTMTRGKPTQSILVVPDSGTGELSGLAGGMVIDIVEGKHFYTFEYSL